MARPRPLRVALVGGIVHVVRGRARMLSVVVLVRTVMALFLWRRL